MRKPLIVLQVVAFCAAAYCLQSAFQLSKDERLVLGAKLGRGGWVRESVASGASVNARDEFELTALTCAVIDGDEALVRELLAAGADASAECQLGQALLYSASYNRANVVEILLEAGDSPDAKGLDEGTALHVAPAQSALDACRVLLAYGGDVHARNRRGETPLMMAASREGSAGGLMQLLIEQGAALNARDNRGDTALAHAIDADDLEVARILIDAGAVLSPPPVSPLAHRATHQ